MQTFSKSVISKMLNLWRTDQLLGSKFKTEECGEMFKNVYFSNYNTTICDIYMYDITMQASKTVFILSFKTVTPRSILRC